MPYLDLVRPVSSRLDYVSSYPESRLSKEEVTHELKHLKMRERVGVIVSVVSLVLLVLAAVGILGGGHLFVGALGAMALFSGLYAYVCRQASRILEERQIFWEKSLEKKVTEMDPSEGSSSVYN